MLGFKRYIQNQEWRNYNVGNNYIAYSDGSGDNIHPNRPGGAAYIILDETGKVLRKRAKGCISTTNNRMELLAIVSIVNALPAHSYVTINTDSEYCIKALRSKNPKANLDLIEMYHKICSDKSIYVNLVWVKGHSGVKYNEECDKMANEAYQKMRDAYSAKPHCKDLKTSNKRKKKNESTNKSKKRRRVQCPNNPLE